MTRGRAPSPSRRRLLRNAAIVGASAWVPAFRHAEGDERTCADPPDFPGHVERWRQGFTNWSGGIVVDDVWTCAPRDAREVLDVADWAAAHGYRLRARGAGHNWSPLVLDGSEQCDDRVVLVSTVEHLTGTSLVPGRPGQVRVAPGVSVEALMNYLAPHGLGLTSAPTVGDVTVGGMLAIAAHGSSLPARDEDPVTGTTYGSFSDRVVEITVVAWDRRRARHRLLAIPRHSPAARAVLANLGRVFVTSVVIQAAEDVNLRCESRFDVPISELLGPPDRGGRSFASFLDETGRVEVLWFPFTEEPWLKTWSVRPERPLLSRSVDGPYNYPFTDNYPDPIAELVADMMAGNSSAGETMGPVMRAVTMAGITATASHDLWGPARHLLLYTRSTTLRADMTGHAVLVRRRDVQSVLHVFHEVFTTLLEEHRARGSFPVNMPVEIRACGLDSGEAVTRGAAIPTLSPMAPVRGRPELDIAVWLNSVSLTVTPDRHGFRAELEERLLHELGRLDVVVRPEWSKSWGYGDDGPWTGSDAFAGWIPRSFGRGDWARAVASLAWMDPNGVFSSPFLDGLLQPRT
ncbi:MAG: cholesterol oxidase substrate-binding domain-containing protein [Nitriliruptorales bacterium]|nr:cholesterol oxidase substrate-binding domain-containing protein [Nitriliruptorales bacterium]